MTQEEIERINQQVNENMTCQSLRKIQDALNENAKQLTWTVNIMRDLNKEIREVEFSRGKALLATWHRGEEYPEIHHWENLSIHDITLLRDTLKGVA